MALNIKNAGVEQLAAEVARLAGESKTQAIKEALEERKARLLRESEHGHRIDRLFDWLRNEVWPNLPEGVRGKRISREEQEEILGYGPDGV